MTLQELYDAYFDSLEEGEEVLSFSEFEEAMR